VEGTARRTFEFIFLALTLLIGFAVVGGCGAVILAMATPEVGTVATAGLAAGAILVIGLVYLATSMSRDVRLLKQQLLDREQDVDRTKQA
jgi:hypothetical protein